MDISDLIDFFGEASANLDIDIPDEISLPDDIDSIDIDNGDYADDIVDNHNVSFGKTNCPPNASSDGYIYHSEIKYGHYKVYKKLGKWWIYEGDSWVDITDKIS